MPLFRDHPVRSTAIVTFTFLAGYWFTRMLSSIHAFHFTQTSVAMLAIGALVYFISMHHRREGHLLTQTQEEMMLIGGFGLFWVAALLAWRAIQQRGTGTGTELGARPSSRGSGGGWPSGCSRDDVYCVVEEWSYW
ncbi:ubiquitin-conjugating enzyme E2 H [Stygiomarasmius scandens]|uniref:Ubiquitin-conjugating enzyme E2 H n=1 Tax=Marasmiellus scandens TaxID=2682957 RepID=A0ABR1K273_9AGAR